MLNVLYTVLYSAIIPIGHVPYAEQVHLVGHGRKGNYGVCASHISSNLTQHTFTSLPALWTLLLHRFKAGPFFMFYEQFHVKHLDNQALM